MRRGNRSVATVSARALVGVAVIAAHIGIVTPAFAHQRPGSIERVTLTHDGSQANNHAGHPQLSGDGRYFAFSSQARNLMPDNDGWTHVYVGDRVTDTIERASVAPDGSPGFGHSRSPSISKDGRFVAFSSSAANLVPNDTNATNPHPGLDTTGTDIFVFDRETKEMTRVSVASDGTEANDSSQDPVFSGDGRVVTFTSRATTLVPENDDGERHVLVHDLTTGTTETVSQSFNGGSPNGPSFPSTINHDGRFVAYQSFANDIVEDDFNIFQDIFVHDRVTGRTELITVNHAGGPANDSSGLPALSADGRFVSFMSFAGNLVPGTVSSGFNPYIYVRDREEGRTERVSVTSSGEEPNGFSTSPRMSPDGRYVLYHSFAEDLVPGDSNGQQDAFLYDRELKLTEIVSLPHDGSQSNGRTFNASMSSDSRYIGLYSLATNLVPGDTNGFGDGFVRDRGPALGVFDLEAAPSEDSIVVSGAAVFQGSVIATGQGTSTSGAWELGAEIRETRLAYRPELDDLHVTIELTSMHRQFGRAGLPGVTYGFDLTVGGHHYQARAVRALENAPGPSFVLYDCDSAPLCNRVAALEGGYGSTGTEIMMSIPAHLIGAEQGATLSELRAWTGFTDAGTPSPMFISQAGLGPADVPTTEVALTIAPAGESPHWDQAVQLEAVEGRFERAIDISALASGPYDVWARSCVGVKCGEQMTTVSLGSEDVEPVPTSIALDLQAHRDVILARATLTSPETGVLPGRPILFYVDGELAGSATTGDGGTATLELRRNIARPGALITAVFEGDDAFAESHAEARLPRGKQ